MQVDSNKLIGTVLDRLAWGVLVAVGWAAGQALVGMIPGI